MLPMNTEELLKIVEHSDFVKSVAFSPDGTRLTTASQDRTAKIFDAATGELLQTLFGHTNGLEDARFSPDGTHLVTAGRDRTVRLYILDPAELRQRAYSRLSRWWAPEECDQYLHQAECPEQP